jgi:hypothetical protein
MNGDAVLIYFPKVDVHSFMSKNGTPPLELLLVVFGSSVYY